MIDYTKYRMNQLNSACAEFIRRESAGSLLLMLATIIAMVLANSPMAETYEHALHLFVDLPLLPDMSLLHWVNDGLMAIFFLVVGMEIKREFLFGELKSLSATLLPIAAAVGGMLIPAALYSLFNMGGPTAQGWAIPMSTDIAFSLGVLAFAAKREILASSSLPTTIMRSANSSTMIRMYGRRSRLSFSSDIFSLYPMIFLTWRPSRIL